MKPNHVNEQCAAMMGWKFFQTGEQLPHGKYAGGPGWWTGSTFVWVKAFTPRTNRDHAFMAWDSLDELEKDSVRKNIELEWAQAFTSTASLFDYVLDPERLCRAILDVMRPGWEEKQGEYAQSLISPPNL